LGGGIIADDFQAFHALGQKAHPTVDLAQYLFAVGVLEETPNKSSDVLEYALTTCAESRMNQMSFSDSEYASKRKQPRRERFLAEMERVVPWSGLLALIEPYFPKLYALKTVLPIHLLQNWFFLK
jgi:hypothetical protein